MFAAAPGFPFPFSTTIETLLGLGPFFERSLRPVAAAVAFSGASTSGWRNSWTAAWMFDGSVCSSFAPVIPPILTWTKFPAGSP